MEPRIRKARPSDAKAISRAFAQAYQDALRTIPDLPDVTAGIASDIANHQVWIAETGPDCVGGLVLAIHGATAHLMNVGVAPTARGQGLGREFIEFAISAATKAGCHAIELATHRDMPKNVALYERFGWSVTGHEGNKILMSRPI